MDDPVTGDPAGHFEVLAAAVSDLAARVRVLEDQLAVAQVLMTYGPAVDSGSGPEVGRLWADEGEYDSGVGTWVGPDSIASMVMGDQHQSFVRNGCAHVISTPLIRVDGDEAVATCYALLLLRDDESAGVGGLWPAGGPGYRVRRITANEWTLSRHVDGWKVTRRVNRPLDGSEDAHEIFRKVLHPAADSPT